MGIQALLAFAASNETQDLVTVVPWTLIFQICNLFMQVYLIKKYLFKPINDILEKRQNLADKAIKEAREAKEEADSLKDQYERRKLSTRLKMKSADLQWILQVRSLKKR